MTRKNRIFGLGLLVAAWGPQTLAQGNSAALTPNMTVNDPCRAEVSRFEQAIGFIRSRTQGEAVAGEDRERHPVQGRLLRPGRLPAREKTDPVTLRYLKQTMTALRWDSAFFTLK